VKKSSALLTILFLTSFFFSTLPVIAASPIIITDTRHFYPNTTGDDQNYIGTDPREIETIPFERTVGISETFDPIEIGTSDGGTTFEFQRIDKIKQNLDPNELNTTFYNYNYNYFARVLTNPYKAPTTSFRVGNATRRALPASVQKCLISNQIVDITKFISGGNSVCIDREISTLDGPVRVGEIIYALALQGEKLYYKDPNCPPNQIPGPLPDDVFSALASRGYSFKLDIAKYRQLYITGIEPVCANSLSQKITHCDLNDQGEKLNCKVEIRSQPKGAVAAQDIYANFRPASSTPKSVDYGKVKPASAVPDKPNPLSWLARFFKLFYEGELDVTKTFSGPHSVVTDVDPRQINALKSNQTTLEFLLPQKVIEKSLDENQNASGTNQNEVTTDPGEINAETTKLLYKNLTPAKWQ